MKRTLILIIAILLITCGVVGTTVAWISDTTDPVKNTFTYGNIEIKLEETDDGDGDLLENHYDIVPSTPITKDPAVTVLPGSENAWVFVKLLKSADFDTYLQYEIDPAWTALEGFEGVYYLEYSKSDTETKNGVLLNNQVGVKPEVTREMLNSLTVSPTLKIQAYAIQRDSDIGAIATPTDAWNALVAQTSNP